MMRFSLGSLALTCALTLSACAGGSTSDSPPAPNTGLTAAPTSGGDEPAIITTASTAFTDAQADRGRDAFRASCTECHYSSEFSDPQFKFKWSRRSAGNLYQMIQTQMPETAPGSLAPEEAVEIVSYILRMNGFEAGENELSPDRAVLDEISLSSIRDN